MHDLLVNSEIISYTHNGVANFAGNVLLYPFMILLYQILVVLPNQITYHILSLTQELTTTSFTTAVTGDNSLTINLEKSSLLKVFLVIGIAGIIVFILAILISLAKLYLKKEREKDVNVKENLQIIVRRSLVGLVIVVLTPIAFVITTSLVTWLFKNIYNSVLNFDSNVPSTDNNNNTLGHVALVQYWNQKLGDKRSNLDVYKQINGILVFNVWSAGFNLKIDGNENSVKLAWWLNEHTSGNMIQQIADEVLRTMNVGFNSGSHLGLSNVDDFSRWNLILSIITSLVMLYLIIMFVVSVLVRLLETYVYMLVGPIIVFWGIMVDKIQTKWLSQTFQKIVSVQIGILGYFLFNILYIIIISTVLSSTTKVEIRYLQFGLLFAGMVLVNKIPALFMKLMNSDEKVVGNELQESLGTIKTITAPLTTAMGTAFGAAISGLRNRNNATMQNNQNFKL